MKLLVSKSSSQIIQRKIEIRRVIKKIFYEIPPFKTSIDYVKRFDSCKLGGFINSTNANYKNRGYLLIKIENRNKMLFT